MWNPLKAVDTALDKGSNVFHNARNEFNDATRAVRRTTSSAVNTARQANWSSVGHTFLDGAGFIPVVGAAADMANAGWYAAKGDWKNASLSAVSAVPGVGDAVAAVKIGAKATGAVAGAAAVSRINKFSQAGSTPVRRATSGRTPFRDEGVPFARDPNPPLTRKPKHASPEYRRARAELKRETIDNPKAPSHVRGWLTQERNARGNNPRKWRNPKGYDTGHADPNDNTRVRWETSSTNRSRGAKFGR